MFNAESQNRSTKGQLYDIRGECFVGLSPYLFMTNTFHCKQTVVEQYQTIELMRSIQADNMLPFPLCQLYSMQLAILVLSTATKAEGNLILSKVYIKSI